MAIMEFLTRNQIQTTTMILVDSGTATVANLIDRNKNTQYVTEGYESNTSTIISIEFGQPTVLSNILIQNHNLLDFRIFYDSVTANSIDIVSGNSSTSYYKYINSITVSSLQLQMDTTIVTAQEKQVGQFIANERNFQFERNPSIKNFKPVIDRFQVQHIMADGGVVLHNIRDKYQTKLKFEFITETFYNQLLSLYETGSPIYYVPFPTTSSWLGNAYEMVWSKDFDFKYSTNVGSIGYSGQITLEETPNA